MKIPFALILFVSLQVNAHGHLDSSADKTITGFSFVWNAYEIFNHLHGVGCCAKSRLYHTVELIGHSSNLFEGVSHFMEENASPIAISAVSLTFNLWAAYQQYRVLQERGLSVAGFLFAPLAAIDFWGHSASAYVAARELVG